MYFGFGSVLSAGFVGVLLGQVGGGGPGKQQARVGRCWVSTGP